MRLFTPELEAATEAKALCLAREIIRADMSQRKVGSNPLRPRTFREAIMLFPKLIWEDPKTGCWLFCGARGKGGYGELKANYKTYRTHRLAWLLSGGIIPDGHGVLHKCDNPPCCRPDHLFTGTNADNIADCKKKGRFKGRLPMFSGSTLKEILDEPSTYGYQTRLAKRFKLSQGTIWKILNGKGSYGV